MKKLVLLSIVLGMAGLSRANTISVSVPMSGTGESAYTVGVSTGLTADQQISSMTISFDKVDLTAGSIGYFYVDLLNLNTPGIAEFQRAGSFQDFFSSYLENGQGISLVAQQVDSHRKRNLTTINITFNSEQLAQLNTYAQDGIFDIGLDPDCFFRISGPCTITYEYRPKTQPGPVNNGPVSNGVPDTASTVALLAMSLLGLILIHRRLRTHPWVSSAA